MAHDFMRTSRFSEEQQCKRCGVFEIERERNLVESQSTHQYVTYWRDGKSYDSDPGCVARDVA